jgi:hypothetical protein
MRKSVILGKADKHMYYKTIRPNQYATTHVYHFSYSVERHEKKVTIPANYTSDFLTDHVELPEVPYFFYLHFLLYIINNITNYFLKATLKPYKFTTAALQHDYLYTLQENRYIADCLFYQSLIINGVGKGKAIAMFLAVRLFGYRAYRACR